VSDEPFTVDRRITLQWLFGAMAASALPGCATSGALGAAATEPPGPWPDLPVVALDAPGYGTDPNLIEGVVPWPRTLNAQQLETAAALCDTILPAEGQYPAPSAIGIHQFVDEWVSAPYPEQRGDRILLLNGFAWLDREAETRHGKSYARLAEADRGAILRDLAAAHAKGADFLRRMKFLTTGAYYTSEQGIEELGYVGNVAIQGDYPGPTKEALAHLEQVLADLKLSKKRA
jgi:hypothetical protein